MGLLDVKAQQIPTATAMVHRQKYGTSQALCQEKAAGGSLKGSTEPQTGNAHSTSLRRGLLVSAKPRGPRSMPNGGDSRAPRLPQHSPPTLPSGTAPSARHSPSLPAAPAPHPRPSHPALTADAARSPLPPFKRDALLQIPPRQSPPSPTPCGRQARRDTADKGAQRDSSSREPALRRSALRARTRTPGQRGLFGS